MEDKDEFLEKLLEHFKKCVKESIDNPSAAKKMERNIIFWDMYEDQLWLDYCFDNMTEEEHAHWRKLLSTEVTNGVVVQTVEQLEGFYGGNVTRNMLGKDYQPLLEAPKSEAYPKNDK
ncbi:hypothetical protein [Enterococcus sp. BWR-S5]|uniref:hypothetical protein n=1 Tax=Enterococcus sp. BWR-S5 TaxID=2787714 RepID=UPI00192389FB|nr:hypothetical protein [Enterococcus sp. BWR-S5]MBL1227123.1 hypothetical protein [Enterococcus sp. BWR-S5]